MEIEGIPVTDDGYAQGVRCSLGHSGNDRFARSGLGFWQCSGCGRLRYTADLAGQQIGVPVRDIAAEQHAARNRS